MDDHGNVIVTEWGNHCIRRVASDGAVTPLFLNRISLPPLLQSSVAYAFNRYLCESGSLHDVIFVVEQEGVPAHRAHLSAKCESFRSMFSAGFQEGVIAEIPIEGTSSAALKALLTYIHMDNIDEGMTWCSLI